MDMLGGDTPHHSDPLREGKNLWGSLVSVVWKCKYWIIIGVLGYVCINLNRDNNGMEILLQEYRQDSEKLEKVSGDYLKMKEEFAQSKVKYAERIFQVLNRNPNFDGPEDVRKLRRSLYRHRFVLGLVDFYTEKAGRARRASYLMDWLKACWKYGDPANRPNGKYAWSIYISMSILMVESQLTNVALTDINARGMSGEVTAAQIILADLPRLFVTAGCKGVVPKIRKINRRGNFIIVRRGDAWDIDNVVLMMLTLLDEKMDKRKTATGAIAAYNGSTGNPADSPYIGKVQKNMEFLRSL